MLCRGAKTQAKPYTEMGGGERPLELLLRCTDPPKQIGSVSRRLESGKEALRAIRNGILGVYRELEPQPFAEWLEERDEREQARQRREGHQEQRQGLERCGGSHPRSED